MMKRIIPLILALFFVVGCSKDSGDDQDNSKDVVVNEPKPIDDNTTPSTNTPINDATPSIDGNSLNANIVANYDSMVIDGKTYEIKNVDTNSVSVVTVPYSIQATYNTSTSKVCLLQDNGTKVKLGFEAGDVLKIYQITQTSMLSVGDLMVAEEDLSEDQTTGTFRGDLTLSYDEDAVFDGNIYLLAWKPYIEGWPHGFTSLDDAIRKSVYLKSEMFIYNPDATSTIRMFPISIAILEILTHQSPIDFTIEYNGTDYPYNNVRITNGKLYLSIATDTYFSSSALGLNRQLIKDPKIYRVNRLDVLPGVFSVSATKKVCFSQGNLQYNPSKGDWRFAPTQYELLDYNESVHKATTCYSPDYDGWVDLLGYGTWLKGGNPMNITTDKMKSSEFQWSDNPFVIGSKWSLLDADEFKYLINSRVMQFFDERYLMVKVNGVWGIMLPPDNWKKEFYPELKYWGSISQEDWPILEQYGAVFFPATGNRNGADIQCVNNYESGIDYWTKTHSSYSTNLGNIGYTQYVGTVFGYYNGVVAKYTYSTNCGLPVRLVRYVDE